MKKIVSDFIASARQHIHHVSGRKTPHAHLIEDMEKWTPTEWQDWLTHAVDHFYGLHSAQLRMPAFSPLSVSLHYKKAAPAEQIFNQIYDCIPNAVMNMAEGAKRAALDWHPEHQTEQACILYVSLAGLGNAHALLRMITAVNRYVNPSNSLSPIYEAIIDYVLPNMTRREVGIFRNQVVGRHSHNTPAVFQGHLKRIHKPKI